MFRTMKLSYNKIKNGKMRTECKMTLLKLGHPNKSHIISSTLQ